MTTTDAVAEVLKDWTPGEEKYGYEIYRLVVHRLRKSGERKRPLDATVLRRMRERAALYGIKTVKPHESVYRKEWKI